MAQSARSTTAANWTHRKIDGGRGMTFRHGSPRPAIRAGGSWINLMTGAFAPRGQMFVGAVAPLLCWRVSARGTGLMAARAFWAERRADALTTEAEALYREYFPNDRRVQDVYRQMAAHLGECTIDEFGALSLIGELAFVVTPESGAQVRSLAFNGDRVELNAELAIPGFDRLDRIKTDLTNRGLAVEISSAEQQDQGVLARLRIRGAS
jgi:type II secretory pathway component PulL